MTPEPIALIEKAGKKYRLIEFNLTTIAGQDTPVRSVKSIVEYFTLEDLLDDVNESTLSPEACAWIDIAEIDVPEPWVDYYRAWVQWRHDQDQASIRESINDGLREITRLSARVHELMALLD